MQRSGKVKEYFIKERKEYEERTIRALCRDAGGGRGTTPHPALRLRKTRRTTCSSRRRRWRPFCLAARGHLPLQGRQESWGTECRASDIGHSKALFVARCSRVGMFAMTAGDGERKDDRACAGGEILR